MLLNWQSWGTELKYIRGYLRPNGLICAGFLLCYLLPS